MQSKIYALPFAIYFTACSFVENPNWNVKAGVLANKKISVLAKKRDGEWIQTAEIVEGDSLVFFRNRYKDAGQEGDGYTTCFTIQQESDSSVFSTGKNELLIIGFGTGMTPNFADTIHSYNLEVVVEGESIRIRGEIDSENISGNYRAI